VTAPKPSAPRVAALRERRAAFGLARLEVWARPEHHAQIRAYAAALHNAPDGTGLERILRCRYPVDVSIRASGYDWDIPRLDEVVTDLLTAKAD